MNNYREILGSSSKSQKSLPQSEPLDARQSRNHAGGYGYTVSDLQQLTRFLILGSQGGTYYVGARTLTKENLLTVERMLEAGHGQVVIETIVQISESGRAISNDPALFALSRCCTCYLVRQQDGTYGYRNHDGEIIDQKDRERLKSLQLRPEDLAICQQAFAALPRVARTGTHLLHFVSLIRQFRHGGPQLTKALASWFNAKSVRDLAFQAVKYQQRDGYSMRDVLRLAHAKPEASDEARNILYHWMVKGWENVGEEPHSIEAVQLVWAFERAKLTRNEDDLVELIHRYRLPREALPTEALRLPKIWQALLETMPLEALIRNLGVMTKIGLIKPLEQVTAQIAARLQDGAAIKKARLHPIKLLAALTTYQSGKGVRGSNTWEPVSEIVDALNDAFYLAFACVEPSNKRLLLALDTSGSMHHSRINGITGMECHTASGAMALVTAAAEKHAHIIGVDTNVQELNISSRQRLDDVVAKLRSIGGGGTNLALPMEYALKKGLEVDAFVIFTDSETWAGNQHPVMALQKYREQTGIAAKIINVQMASTRTTINDPDDPMALEIIGFDTSAPQVISEFIGGNL